MKRYIYISWLLSLVLLFNACEKIEPDFFDGNYNGAYFDYNTSEEFRLNLNFGDYTSGMPQEVIVPVRIKLLGYLTDEKRVVSIKTKAIEGYEFPEITIPEVYFSDKEYEKDIEIAVKRPETENEVRAVCIYLDGNGDLGSGIKGKEEYYIYVTETYEKPDLWSGVLEKDFLGGWSKGKQIFLTNLTGDDSFLTRLYSRITEEGYNSVDYSAATQMNALIFNTYFTEESSEIQMFPFPILGSSDNPKYNEPYFWNKYSDYVCKYTPARFFLINKYGGTLNTENIESFYKDEKNIKKMAEAKRGFHAEDVLEMLEKYNLYASKGYPISDYKDSCWVKMETKNMNYYKNVAVPYWWSDPDGLGTAEIVKGYFGEYSEAKYKFMMQYIIEKEGSENFVAARMFPFILDTDTRSYQWDEAAGGEEYMKECYKTIKKVYDEWPIFHSSFSFPELDLE